MIYAPLLLSDYARSFPYTPLYFRLAYASFLCYHAKSPICVGYLRSLV